MCYKESGLWLSSQIIEDIKIVKEKKKNLKRHVTTWTISKDVCENYK